MDGPLVRVMWHDKSGASPTAIAMGKLT